MQISALSFNNSTAFKCNHPECINRRIEELQQKRIANQWATEGCNGGLSTEEENEWEYLMEQTTNSSEHRPNKEIERKEIYNIPTTSIYSDKVDDDDDESEYLTEQAINDLECRSNKEIERKEFYNTPTVSIYSDETPYGVPLSTFYGDWAR